MTGAGTFEQHADEYDAWFDSHPLEYQLELDAIRKLLPRSGAGIEIGAGTGRFTGPLDIAMGIEPSAAMRRIALVRGIPLIGGMAESLPLDARCCNYALLVTTVCFLESPETAFREVHRVLEDDGWIVIGMIDRTSPLGRKYEEKKQQSVFYREAVFHSTGEIVALLKDCGFGQFQFVQALLPGDTGPGSKPDIKPGYGQGSFVVIRARKLTHY